MFIEIGKELAKMHDADIIHGDLTSSNILLKDAKYNLKEGEKTYSAIVKNIKITKYCELN